MSMLWSGLLILFLLIPLAIIAYIILLRRRRRFSVRYSSLSLVRDAVAPRQAWIRRHLPFALFLIAISSLIMAFTRPVATVTIPSNKSTIILAMDVSRSMCSTDISPNRLEVAKDAAQSFIQNHRSGRLIGIVAFAGFAELIQPPTDDTELLMTAVENLTTARRTAIGSAILRSIDAIAEIDDRVAPTDISASTGTPELAPSDVQLAPHIIVLLTDGASNAGPYPLTAAQQAVARGVRVYTIGFGTQTGGSSMNCGDFPGGDLLGNQGFGFNEPFGGGGGGFRREIDEVTLRQIAELTDAEYYAASSADELQKVFQNLPTYLVATRETIEVSVFFTAFAVLAIVLALILSFLWNPLSH